MARGLEQQIIDFINNNDKAEGLRGIFREAKKGLYRDNPLLICFRKKDKKDNIDIYYKGRTTINVNINKNGLNAHVSEEYTRDELKNSNVKIVEKFKTVNRISNEDISIQTVDKMAKISRGKVEREVQQYIIMRNNENENSDWYCVDMEYETNKYGKFDIIAVSKEKNCNGKYELAVIELKVGNGAMGTSTKDMREWINSGSRLLENVSEWSKINGSGITGHFSKFIGFLTDEPKVEELKNDVLKIIETYYKTSLCDVNVKNLYEAGKETIIFDEPKIIFLNYTDAISKSVPTKSKIDSLKEVFKNNVAKNKFSIKKVWNCNILEKYKDRFLCIFRDEEYGPIFSDVEISEAKNIFDEEAYK